MSLTLIEIEITIQELLDLRDEQVEEGALPDQLALIDEAIKEYFAREVRKVNGVAQAIRAYQEAAKICKEEVARLHARAAALEARAQKIKDNAMAAMQAFGITKLETPAHSLRIQSNGGNQAVEIEEIEAVPLDMQRVTVKMNALDWEMVKTALDDQYVPELFREVREPDHEAIRKGIERFGGVAGCRLKERGVHLRAT